MRAMFDEDDHLLIQRTLRGEIPYQTILKIMNQTFRKILNEGVYCVEDFIRDLSDEIDYHNIKIPYMYNEFYWDISDIHDGGDLYTVFPVIVDGDIALSVRLDNLYPPTHRIM